VVFLELKMERLEGGVYTDNSKFKDHSRGQTSSRVIPFHVQRWILLSVFFFSILIDS
jgi:hypothetical protein